MYVTRGEAEKVGSGWTGQVREVVRVAIEFTEHE